MKMIEISLRSLTNEMSKLIEKKARVEKRLEKATAKVERLDCKWTWEEHREWLLNVPTEEEANRIIDSFDRVTSSIEQEPKWIPVTERLPDEGYSVLVMRITDENYKYMRVATYQGDCWMDDTDKFNKPNPHKVIAWMPLPEPYEEDEE